MEPSIAFTCVAPAHQAGEGGPDKLTVHDGKWAFCFFDARADGHQWGSSGGLTVTMLRASAVARGKEQVKGGGTA
jgi:hypothetical protein